MHKAPSYEAFEWALTTLDEALSKPPANDLERDGVIQRFEFTFECAKRSIRECLIALGRVDVSSSPKPLLRDAHAERLIDSVNEWFEFVEARTNAARVYTPRMAEEVYEAAVRFAPKARELMVRLTWAVNP